MNGYSSRDAKPVGRIYPVMIALFAVMLDTTSLPGTAPAPMMPSVTLAVVFYWTMQRPNLISSIEIFVIGLVLDLLAGLPPGLSSLSMLVAIRLLAFADRDFIAGSFIIMWGCFILVASAMFSIRWMAASFWSGSLFDFANAMIEAAMTIAIFPVINWLNAMAEPFVPKVWHASGK